MIAREQLVQEVQRLSEEDVERVGKYIAVLKSRAQSRRLDSSDENTLRAMYAEARDEDFVLADSGLADYAAALKKEDGQ